MKKIGNLKWLGLCFILWPFIAWASPSVELVDLAYTDIDKLIASNLIEDAISSQRPWTRAEFARLTLEAENALPRMCSSCENRYEILLRISRLKHQFEPEIAFMNDGQAHWVSRPVDRIQTFLAGLNSHERSIPFDNGMGFLDGSIEPMTQYMEGLRFTPGSNLLLRSDHWATYPGVASLYVQPDLMIPGGNEGSFGDVFNFHKLYGTIDLGPVDFTLGRDTVVYGFGEHGGILLSDNARPLDMIKVSLPSPVILPGFLKALGSFRCSNFVADLGSNRESPHAKLIGMILTARPSSIFEISLEHTYIIGGDKRQDTRWSHYLSEWFFLRPGFGRDGDFADHRVGWNMQLMLPFLSNAEMDLEMVFEDLGIDSIVADLTYRKGLMGGLYFPILLGDFNSSLRIRYYQTSPLIYRHGGFISGYQLDHRILGLPSGNASQGITLKYQKEIRNASRLLIGGTLEQYDAGIYNQKDETQMFLIETKPLEHRLRFEAEFEFHLNSLLSFKPKLAYERVWNFGFVDGATVANIIGGIWMTWKVQ